MIIAPEKCTDIELVFEGGQKSVFKAKHELYGSVAIKIGEFSSVDSLERIKREVNCLKELDSPYFPRNYAFSIDYNANTFEIIEEYIESKKLTELRENFKSEKSIIRLTRQLIDGLSVIWDKNIIHRDLKPDNILITKDFTPKIIDLGIARFLDYEGLTKTASPMGPCTPIYASPEQILNKKDIIDVRTDFFALGIILLELYLGNHPFHPAMVGNKDSIPINICNGRYVSPMFREGTSIEFAKLFEKMLQVQPFKRFRNYKAINDYILSNWGE